MPSWLDSVAHPGPFVRLKDVARVVNGATPRSGEPSYWEGDIVWVTPDDLGDMPGEVVRASRRSITSAGYESCNTTLVPPGSVVVSTRAPIGHVAIAGVPLCVNQGCRALVPRDPEASRYLYYVLLAAKTELQARGRGSTFQEIGGADLATVRVPWPDEATRRGVVALLDDRTAGARDGLRALDDLLSVLQERRRALVRRAVTRGLSAAPVQGTGVRWLPDLPTGWVLAPLRRFLRGVEQGWSPVAEDRAAGAGEWGVIKLSAVSRGAFRPQFHKTLPCGVEPDSRFEIRPGDFLLTRANTPALVGDVALVEECPPRLMLCDLVYRLDVDETRLSKRFLRYWLLSGPGRSQIARDARGSSESMVKVAQGHIRSWLVAVPPLPEQQRIADHLDASLLRLDLLGDELRHQAHYLREYRRAAVTSAILGVRSPEGFRTPAHSVPLTADRSFAACP